MSPHPDCPGVFRVKVGLNAAPAITKVRIPTPAGPTIVRVGNTDCRSDRPDRAYTDAAIAALRDSIGASLDQLSSAFTQTSDAVETVLAGADPSIDTFAEVKAYVDETIAASGTPVGIVDGGNF